MIIMITTTIRMMVIMIITFVCNHSCFRYGGHRAFSVAGPTVWNSLPKDMQDPECSMDSYRQSLKTFLFLQY